MDKLDRVYVMRAGIGALSGIISAIIISAAIPDPAYNQGATVGIAIVIAIVAYIASVGIARKLAPSVPKELRRKVSTDGIVPFIFVQLVAMIILYTALHQPLLAVIANQIHNSSGTDVTHASGVQKDSVIYVSSTVSPQSRGGAAGSPAITGWVEYLRFFKPDCTGSSVAAGNVTLGPDGTAPRSMPVTVNATLGVESYYSGDSHYRGTLSDCSQVTTLQP